MKAGPWHIAGKLLILKPWEPQMVLTKEKLSTIPIWVQFAHVPLEFWTEQGLSYIASAIGKPLHADDMTEKRQRLSFAKICVEIHVDTPLLDVVEVEYANGDSAFVTVAGLPSVESVEQAMLNPVGSVLHASGSHGQVSLPSKLPSGSPGVASLPKNTVVMTDGVASDWVLPCRGLDAKTPPDPNGSNNIPPSKVHSGLSNIFAILQSTMIEEEHSVPAMEMASDSPLSDLCPSPSAPPLVTKRVKDQAKGKGGGGAGGPSKAKRRR
ncbi:hypothetical protein RHSIM_Rhsim01G0107300 [Rhododendron simsii]|uniref:DUF4283 domain-containing protein n=1 Tax=Rhododendron simsii TaxID=118357 RepID=A0A834HKH0_RHOSS|nr:hypothetical protein RHSIM_Rhsim01G0107300 [Rhododendron simsii]